MKNSSSLLFVTDCDGTLLNSSKEISTRNMEAIKKFVDAGGFFTIASGRPQKGAKHILDALPINAPVICFNGAMLYDVAKGRVLYSFPLPKGIKEAAKDIQERFPFVGIEAFTATDAYIFRNSSYTTYHFMILHEAINEVSLDDVSDSGWLKLFVTGERDQLIEIRDYLLAGYSDMLNAVLSSEHFLEIFNRSCSKGEAIKILKKYLPSGISVAAIGDNDNDIPMLEAADVPMAVGNCESGLKKITQKVFSSNDDDGVAEALEYLMGSL